MILWWRPCCSNRDHIYKVKVKVQSVSIWSIANVHSFSNMFNAYIGDMISYGKYSCSHWKWSDLFLIAFYFRYSVHWMSVTFVIFPKCISDCIIMSDNDFCEKKNSTTVQLFFKIESGASTFKPCRWEEMKLRFRLFLNTLVVSRFTS